MVASSRALQEAMRLLWHMSLASNVASLSILQALGSVRKNTDNLGRVILLTRM